MEKFEQYFVEQSLLDDEETTQQKYMVVDSDLDSQNPQAQFHFQNKKRNGLSEYDLNLQNISRNQSLQSHASTFLGISAQQGRMSKFLEGKKQGKETNCLLLEEIAKAESQCEALEMLIENVITKQADLIVKKNKIIRNRNNRNREMYQIQQQNREFREERDSGMGMFSLDIKNTVKTIKGKRTGKR